MNAGPEMDARVAEVVMGWERCDNADCGGCESPIMVMSDGDYVIRHPETGKLGWSPSTDISAACDVVEKMESLPVEDRYDFLDTLILDVCGALTLAHPDERWPFLTASPHAICLAALKAMGEEV